MSDDDSPLLLLDLSDDVLCFVMAFCSPESMLELSHVNRFLRSLARRTVRSSTWQEVHRDELQAHRWQCGQSRAVRLLSAGTPSRRSMTCMPGGLTAVDVTASGWLAAGGQSGQLMGWRELNATSFRHQYTVSHPGVITALALRDDGVVATACEGNLSCFDLQSKQLVQVFVDAHDSVFAVAWAPHPVSASAELLSGGADRALRLWNIEVGECVREALDCAAVSALVFCKGDCPGLGGVLLSPSRDFSIAVRDAQSLLPCGPALIGHTRPVLCVAAHGDRVASGSGSGEIRIWSLHTRECTGVVLASAGAGAVYAVALSGAALLSGCCRETCVRVWREGAGAADERSTWRVVARLNRQGGGAGSVCTLAMDHGRVASGDNVGGVPHVWS